MPPKRKRGPYKQYLLDPAVPIPKSTLWFRQNLRGHEGACELPPDHAEENLNPANALDPAQHPRDAESDSSMQVLFHYVPIIDNKVICQFNPVSYTHLTLPTKRIV